MSRKSKTKQEGTADVAPVKGEEESTSSLAAVMVGHDSVENPGTQVPVIAISIPAGQVPRVADPETKVSALGESLGEGYMCRAEADGLILVLRKNDPIRPVVQIFVHNDALSRAMKVEPKATVSIYAFLNRDEAEFLFGKVEAVFPGATKTTHLR
jgi:hypothetical protein